MHGPTCIFLANLTPFSLVGLLAAAAQPALTALDLGHTGLGPKGCADLAAAAAARAGGGLQRLVRLSLATNGVGDRGVAAAAVALGR